MRRPNHLKFAGGCYRVAGRRTLGFVLAALIAVVLSAMPAPASAKIEIEGRSDALRLEAQDASLEEVLAALSAKFNLTYSSEPELDRTVSGAYSGTLQQVVRRILHGYDYVLNFSVERIELNIVGESRAEAQPSRVPTPSNRAAVVSPTPLAPRAINPKPAMIPGQTAYR
jgi:hypothetical protein